MSTQASGWIVCSLFGYAYKTLLKLSSHYFIYHLPDLLTILSSFIAYRKKHLCLLTYRI